MLFSFRHTVESDIVFYTECFQNEEFQYMLYGQYPLKPHQLKKYIANNDKDYKFVFSVDKNGASTIVGFSHFYYTSPDLYTYIGGIHPLYFNSGLGAYASIASISLFLSINNEASLTTGIYKHNTRSLKLHRAIGFSLYKETLDKYILDLNRDTFNNPFVLNLKRRIQYRLI